MGYIISKITTEITFPPYHKMNQNRKPLTIHINKDEINELDDEICKFLVTSRPHVYRYADDEEVPFSDVEDYENDKGFNAKHFLIENVDNIESALLQINRKELFEVCKALRLTNYFTQTNERIRERIINDIRVQSANEPVSFEIKTPLEQEQGSEEWAEAEEYLVVY